VLLWCEIGADLHLHECEPPVAMGETTGANVAAKHEAFRLTWRSLFSGAPLKVFLKLLDLVGWQIRSHSHVSNDRAPLGSSEFPWVTRHMAATAIHRPEFRS